MKTYLTLNPKPKTDLGKILGKNFLVKDELVSLIYKITRSIAKTSNTRQESKTHNKTINNIFYGNR